MFFFKCHPSCAKPSKVNTSEPQPAFGAAGIQGRNVVLRRQRWSERARERRPHRCKNFLHKRVPHAPPAGPTSVRQRGVSKLEMSLEASCDAIPKKIQL